MKLKGQLITGRTLEEVRAHLGLSLLDYCWILGIYSATYTRITNKNKDLPVDHVHAALIRYLVKHIHDYPYHRVVTQTTQTTQILKQLRVAYQGSKRISIAAVKLDLSNYGHLGTLLLRGYSSANNYETGPTDMPLSVARWANVVIECLEKGYEARIQAVINDEASAHGIKPSKLLVRGWTSTV